MPNWAENDLSISGNLKEQNALKEFVKGDNEINGGSGLVFDFDKIIPYPEEYKKQDELVEKWFKEHEINGKISESDWATKPQDGYSSGGYDWCVFNWGTKWNLSGDTYFQERDRSLFYSFSTAWSPPTPIIYALSERFPKLRLTLKYYEQGMGFSGKLVIKGGKTLEDFYNNAYRGERGG